MCYDRHYPESYRSCVLQGADLIVVPVANDKTEPLELFRWEIRVAAFQNSVNVVMCNRVGREAGMDFCGESVFADASGAVAAAAGDREELLLAELDLAGTAAVREKRQYLPLRRPEVFRYF